jgi:DMSO/TMAO reductase YedYZ molybdopterin-dependent catalytic subunit
MRTVAADYFSRAKDPKEATNAFVGVRLTDILAVARPARDARRVTIKASDAYSAGFTLRQVKADYIDETRPGVVLPMIIAYSEDGIAYTGANPFRLVMGQALEGDYNRQYWVRMIVSITVE